MGAAAADVDDGQLWKELPCPSPNVPATDPSGKVNVCHESSDDRVRVLERGDGVRAGLDGFDLEPAFLQRRHAQFKDRGVVLHV